MPAGVSSHVRSGIVGRRQQSAASRPSRAASRAVTAESGSPRAEGLRAHEVEAEVAVAEPEPRLAAERRGALERVPRLVRTAPAALLVGQAGERVEDRVEVGRDVEAEHLDVVADVADDRELARVDHLDEPAQEARAADAARQADDLHAASGLDDARVRGPSAAADAVEILDLVDVVGEVRQVDGDGARARARKRAALPGP